MIHTLISYIRAIGQSWLYWTRRITSQGGEWATSRIKAEVKDASFSFDSPAIYRIEHPEIDKVLSFTHTYVGQAQEGEWIEARGVVEKTAHETRLVVGTTREAKGEWIRCLSTRTSRGI